uniref:DUF2163 domain-containing protein n=1 Tax=uncultured Erythrobacter sp. TaxID=263913 RepID=UPI0026323FFB|nr:DUF2163 domain-containing protein [uncultured Erythrobacter sp.]
MRVFFDRPLDTVATFWRIFRKDGTTLGFTSHDCDLQFGGILHRAAPGMAPSAIRLTSDLSEDSAEVEGALSHGTIRGTDIAAGLYDEAAITIGAVDWESLENHSIYSGQLGRIEDDGRAFTAELRSAKAVLEADLVPRTSPTCRAAFCGPGCGLSAHVFTTLDTLEAVDLDANRVKLTQASGSNYVGGQVRFLDGPQTGVKFAAISSDGVWLALDRSLIEGTPIGTRVEVREGCDHTLATCTSRFANALNFRGEPFLPGNDSLSRYGQPAG